MIPDLIVAVIVRPQEMSEIWGDRDGSLLKTRSNPRGIRIQGLYTVSIRLFPLLRLQLMASLSRRLLHTRVLWL
jgi:hypothetical protein